MDNLNVDFENANRSGFLASSSGFPCAPLPDEGAFDVEGFDPLGNTANSQAFFEDEFEYSHFQIVGDEDIKQRYRLLSASKRILKGHIDSTNRLLGCQVWTLKDVVCVGHGESHAHDTGLLSGVVTCGSLWACPVCSLKIASKRRDEVREAIYRAKKEDLEVYMMTFTFRHTREDSLEHEFECFGKAKTRFWQDRKVKEEYQKNFVGKISSTEITWFYTHGWHLHVHVIMFGKKGLDIDELQSFFAEKWVYFLGKSGLDGTLARALTFQDANAVKDYLTKMSCEMTLSNVTKKGRKGHYAPFQLLDVWRHSTGERKELFAGLWLEYIKATSGHRRRALVWSDGLKDRYGIRQIEDDDIADDANDEYSVLLVVKSGDWKRLLSHDDIAIVRSFARFNDLVSLRSFLDYRGVRYWDSLEGYLSECGEMSKDDYEASLEVQEDESQDADI